MKGKTPSDKQSEKVVLRAKKREEKKRRKREKKVVIEETDPTKEELSYKNSGLRNEAYKRYVVIEEEKNTFERKYAVGEIDISAPEFAKARTEISMEVNKRLGEFKTVNALLSQEILKEATIASKTLQRYEVHWREFGRKIGGKSILPDSVKLLHARDVGCGLGFSELEMKNLSKYVRSLIRGDAKVVVKWLQVKKMRTFIILARKKSACIVTFFQLATKTRIITLVKKIAKKIYKMVKRGEYKTEEVERIIISGILMPVLSQ